MQKTANQIKSSFETLASGHYQIHSFLYAQEFEQQAYENLIYPLMLVYPLGGSLSGTTYSRNYRVIIADRVLKSEGNELEVESDTQLIALDVLAYWMKLGQNERFTITSSNTITPFWEKWGDEVTGHFVDIGIEEFYDFNSCAIPLSGSIPTPVNPCKDARISVNSVVYGNAPSDSNFNVVVKDQLGSLVGSLIGGDWIVNTGGICADATYTIEDTLGNILYTGSIVSGGSLTQAIGNSTLNINDSVGTLISSESILAEGTDSYNVADSVAVIKDSAGTTLKSENILATASENITINDSLAVIKDSANNTILFEDILAEGSKDIVIDDSVAVIKDSANLTLKTENILAEATENIVINDSLVNVRKSDNVLISAVSVKAENTENYLVADSTITNAAISPTYSQLVKATEGLILPTQEIQNNGVASGFIPSVGTINVTTNSAPTSFTITGRTIDIVVPSGAGSYDIDLVDRFGNAFPTASVSSNATWDLRTLTPFDFADIFLSRITTPSSAIVQAITEYVEDCVAGGIWEDLVDIRPMVYQSNNQDALINLKYPFLNESGGLGEAVGSPTINANGITTNGTSSGVIFPFNQQEFGNDLGFCIYSRTSGADARTASYDIGSQSLLVSGISIKRSSNITAGVYRNNALFATGTDVVADGLGLYDMVIDSGVHKLTRNGVNLSLTYSANYNSVLQRIPAYGVGSRYDVSTGSLTFGGLSAARNYAFAAVHKIWTPAKSLTHYTAVQKMQTTLSRQV